MLQQQIPSQLGQTGAPLPASPQQAHTARSNQHRWICGLMRPGEYTAGLPVPRIFPGTSRRGRHGPRMQDQLGLIPIIPPSFTSCSELDSGPPKDTVGLGRGGTQPRTQPVWVRAENQAGAPCAHPHHCLRGKQPQAGAGGTLVPRKLG